MLTLARHHRRHSHSHAPQPRQTNLHRDSHLEAFLKNRGSRGSRTDSRDASAATQGGGRSLGGRRSLQVDLRHALRMSEARPSSRLHGGSSMRMRDESEIIGGTLSEPLIAETQSGGTPSPTGRKGAGSPSARNTMAGGGDVEDGTTKQQQIEEYESRAMLDEICELLDCTNGRKFKQIAIFRSFVLIGFFVLFLVTDCNVGPGHKFECTWLSLL